MCHEEVYLKDYEDGWQAEDSLSSYFRFYCDERLHQSLGYRTPAAAHQENDSRDQGHRTKTNSNRAQKNTTSNGTQERTPLQRPRKTF